MVKKKAALTILSEVFLLLATAILWIPIYYFFIGAFKTRTDIVNFPLAIKPSMITLDNFVYTFTKMKFFSALKNTGIITVVALVAIVVFASMAGFAIARIDRKLFKFIYSALITLMVIPFIGTVIPLVVQSVEIKTYNTLLGGILIQVGWNLPFAVFLYTGFMRGIPKEMEESAYIDGCSMYRMYAQIFLPLLAPVTATCLIRCGIGIWNDYLVSKSILNDAVTPTLMVTIHSFFGERRTEYGYAFAGIIAASLPIVMTFVSFQKYFIKGLVAGAVKG